MNSQNHTPAILGLLILIIVIAGGYFLTKDKTSQTSEPATTSQNDQMDNLDEMEKEEINDDMKKMEEPGGMMDDHSDNEMSDGSMMKPAETAPLAAGIYTTYNADAVASSEAEHIILNFSATWCPSCRTLDKDITANESAIPAGTEIYKVDYDTSISLRQKYGVTTQHTLVEVDKNGNLIKKWSGGNTLNSVIAQL